ncbi:MAG: hypothetical protein D6702_11910 [Planctomycetota bacterium]|nr:MAG: hypothetical protein D6702_11910 [Planctomycetota bacterium]
MSPALPTDPVREAVERLRAEGELLGGLRRAWEEETGAACPLVAAELRRVHFKPFTRARLVVRGVLAPAEPGGPPRQQFFALQVYPLVEAARRRRRSYLARSQPAPCHGPPAFVVPAWHAAGFSLPNGPLLRNLAKFLDAGRTRTWLEKKGQPELAARYHPDAIELVRYVPRKRALLRLPGGDGVGGAYFKLFTQAEYRTAARNAVAILRAGEVAPLGFTAPAILARGKKKRALALAELPGTRLTESFAAGPPELLAAAGAAVAGLHRSMAWTRARWSPGRELEAVAVAANDLIQALPGQAEAVRRLVARLGATFALAEGFQPAPIHANLFGDQILAGAAGIGIVDWDDLCLGDPAFDVGRTAAHFLFAVSGRGPAERERLAAFLAGHAERAGESPPEPRLAWHIAAALLLRAKISALRPLAPGWPEQVERSLAMAHAVLDRPAESWRAMFSA